MPRTKQVRKTRSIRETTEESDSLVRDFERHAAQQIHKMEADLRMQISSLSNSVEVALSRLPMEIRKLTLGELLAAEASDDNDVDMESAAESPPPSPVPTTAKAKKKPKRVTAASDDGYATECTTRGTHVSRINTTRNSNGRPARAARSSSSNRNAGRQPRAARSSSSNRQTGQLVRANRSTSRSRNSRLTTDYEQQNRKDLLKSGCGPPKTSSKFKTPMLKNQPIPCFDTVTPKVKPNTPMNILRRPRDGEMVLSMQGSPLLVSSIVQERTANINVPLHNGNVISLLPNAGLRLSHMPALDHETMQQLKTLKGHIDMVIGSK